MTSTSRRLSAKVRGNKNNHEPGKNKGENCQKSPLKTWGMRANPYKLRGGLAERFVDYSNTVRALNK